MESSGVITLDYSAALTTVLDPSFVVEIIIILVLVSIAIVVVTVAVVIVKLHPAPSRTIGLLLMINDVAIFQVEDVPVRHAAITRHIHGKRGLQNDVKKNF